MSQLHVDQSSGCLRGWMLYHADPGWELHPPDPDSRPIGPVCDNGEGRGHWVAFDPETSRWGAVLRRGDTPYNDCLPPSESLLTKSLSEPGDLDQTLRGIRNEAEANFYNPFNAVLGNPVEDRLLYLQQSFQAESQSIESGIHTLADKSALDEENDSLPPPLVEGVPPWDELVDGFQSGSFELSGAIQESPMREIQALTLFQLDSENLRVEHGFGDPEPSQMEWCSLTRSQV